MSTPKHMGHMITWQVLCVVERRFHRQESNRQPLPRDLGISPPSSSSLGSSSTKYIYVYILEEFDPVFSMRDSKSMQLDLLRMNRS